MNDLLRLLEIGVFFCLPAIGFFLEVESDLLCCRPSRRRSCNGNNFRAVRAGPDPCSRLDDVEIYSRFSSLLFFSSFLLLHVEAVFVDLRHQHLL